jgi:hypothetical protein
LYIPSKLVKTRNISVHHDFRLNCGLGVMTSSAASHNMVPGTPPIVRHVYGSERHVLSYRLPNSIFYDPSYANALEAAVQLDLHTFLRPPRGTNSHEYAHGRLGTLMVTLISNFNFKGRICAGQQEKEALLEGMDSGLWRDDQLTAQMSEVCSDLLLGGKISRRATLTGYTLLFLVFQLRPMVDGVLANLDRCIADPWVAATARIRGFPCQDSKTMLEGE